MLKRIILTFILLVFIIGESKTNYEKYYLKTFQHKENKNEETKITKKNISGNGSNNVTNYS